MLAWRAYADVYSPTMARPLRNLFVHNQHNNKRSPFAHLCLLAHDASYASPHNVSPLRVCHFPAPSQPPIKLPVHNCNAVAYNYAVWICAYAPPMPPHPLAGPAAVTAFAVGPTHTALLTFYAVLRPWRLDAVSNSHWTRPIAASHSWWI